MDKSNLVNFLYLLLRDHVAPGTIERIVMDIEAASPLEKIYSNLYLEAYAKELMSRILGVRP